MKNELSSSLPDEILWDASIDTKTLCLPQFFITTKYNNLRIFSAKHLHPVNCSSYLPSNKILDVLRIGFKLVDFTSSFKSPIENKKTWWLRNII